MNGQLFMQVLTKVFTPKPKPKRLELRFVNYTEGDQLVRDGWTIAPEDGNNHVFGMVYLERLDRPNAQHHAEAGRPIA